MIVTPWHNPLRLAGQIAMLTQLTDQPLHLGLGRGTANFEFDAFGLDMGERRGRFQETWEIRRRAMTGEPFSYAGRYVSVPERIRIRPQPRAKGDSTVLPRILPNRTLTSGTTSG